jgi:HlyD family secretion protein
MHIFRVAIAPKYSAVASLLLLMASWSNADPKKAGDVVLESKGYLVTPQQVSVSPQVAGVVVELPIEEGQRVKKGDVLARLDAREYQARLRLAQAQLQVAEAQHAKVRQAGANADVAIASAEVAVARARLEIAQLRLEQTIIHAPLDGTVLARKVAVGSLVDPAGLNLPSAICELADLRTLEVDVLIQERDLERIAKGQRCIITLEALPTVRFQGTVVRIMPIADRSKGAVPVRVKLEGAGADERVRPEMSAIVQFLAKQQGL